MKEIKLSYIKQLQSHKREETLDIPIYQESSKWLCRGKLLAEHNQMHVHANCTVLKQLEHLFSLCGEWFSHVKS